MTAVHSSQTNLPSENWDDDFEFSSSTSHATHTTRRRNHDTNTTTRHTQTKSMASSSTRDSSDWDVPLSASGDRPGAAGKKAREEGEEQEGEGDEENWDEDFATADEDTDHDHDNNDGEQQAFPAPPSARAKTRRLVSGRVPVPVPNGQEQEPGEMENWDDSFEYSPPSTPAHVAAKKQCVAREQDNEGFDDAEFGAFSTDDDDGDEEEDKTVTARNRRAPVHAVKQASPPPPVPALPGAFSKPSPTLSHLEPAHAHLPLDPADGFNRPFPRSPTTSVFSVPAPSIGGSSGHDSTTHLFRSHTPGPGIGRRDRMSALPPSPPIHKERERRRLRKKSRPTTETVYELRPVHAVGGMGMGDITSSDAEAGESEDNTGATDRGRNEMSTPPPERSTPEPASSPSSPNVNVNATTSGSGSAAVQMTPSKDAIAAVTGSGLLSRGLGSMKRKLGRASAKKRVSSTPSEVALAEAENDIDPELQHHLASSPPLSSSPPTGSGSGSGSGKWFFRGAHSNNAGAPPSSSPPSHHASPLSNLTSGPGGLFSSTTTANRGSGAAASATHLTSAEGGGAEGGTPSAKLVKRKSFGFVPLRRNLGPLNGDPAAPATEGEEQQPQTPTKKYGALGLGWSPSKTPQGRSASAMGSVEDLGLRKRRKSSRNKAGEREKSKSRSRSRAPPTDSEDAEQEAEGKGERREGMRGFMGEARRRISIGMERRHGHGQGQGHVRNKSTGSAHGVSVSVFRKHRHEKETSNDGGADADDELIRTSEEDVHVHVSAAAVEGRAGAGENDERTMRTSPRKTRKSLQRQQRRDVSPSPSPAPAPEFPSTPRRSSTQLPRPGFGEEEPADEHDESTMRTPSNARGHAPLPVEVHPPSPPPPLPPFTIGAGKMKGSTSAPAHTASAGLDSLLMPAGSLGRSPAGKVASGTVGGEGVGVGRRSSLGDLKIPARISAAQTGLRRDLGMVREFAGEVEELRELQATYNSLVAEVQKILDSFAASAASSAANSRATSPSPAPAPPAVSGSVFKKSTTRSRSNTADSSHAPSHPTRPQTQTQVQGIRDQYKELASKFLTINSKYRISWECAELLIELGGGPPAPSPPPISGQSSRQTSGTSSVLQQVGGAGAGKRERAITLSGEDPHHPSPAPGPVTSIGAKEKSLAWRASTGRHDLSARQLMLLKEILGSPDPAASTPAFSHHTHTQEVVQLNEEAYYEEGVGVPGATQSLVSVNREWRWGAEAVEGAMNSTVTLPPSSEEGSSSLQHHSHYANQQKGGQEKRRRASRLGMMGIREMLRALKRQQKQVEREREEMPMSSQESSLDRHHGPGLPRPPSSATANNAEGNGKGTAGRRRAKTSSGPMDSVRSFASQVVNNKNGDNTRSSSPAFAAALAGDGAGGGSFAKASPRRPSLASIFRIGRGDRDKERAGSSSKSVSRERGTPPPSQPPPPSSSAAGQTSNAGGHGRESSSTTATTGAEEEGADDEEEEDWDRMDDAPPLATSPELELGLGSGFVMKTSTSAATIRGSGKKLKAKPKTPKQKQGQGRSPYLQPNSSRSDSAGNFPTGPTGSAGSMPVTPVRSASASRSSLWSPGPGSPAGGSNENTPTPNTSAGSPGNTGSPIPTRTTRLSNVQELDFPDSDVEDKDKDKTPAPKEKGQRRPGSSGGGGGRPNPSRHSSHHGTPSPSAAKTGSVRSMPPNVVGGTGVGEGMKLAMTPENIKPLLENAKEVRRRLVECVEEVRGVLGPHDMGAKEGS